jgi:hypothetical protein
MLKRENITAMVVLGIPAILGVFFSLSLYGLPIVGIFLPWEKVLILSAFIAYWVFMALMFIVIEKGVRV